MAESYLGKAHWHIHPQPAPYNHQQAVQWMKVLQHYEKIGVLHGEGHGSACHYKMKLAAAVKAVVSTPIFDGITMDYTGRTTSEKVW